MHIIFHSIVVKLFLLMQILNQFLLLEHSVIETPRWTLFKNWIISTWETEKGYSYRGLQSGRRSTEVAMGRSGIGHDAYLKSV